MIFKFYKPIRKSLMFVILLIISKNIQLESSRKSQFNRPTCVKYINVYELIIAQNQSLWHFVKSAICSSNKYNKATLAFHRP